MTATLLATPRRYLSSLPKTPEYHWSVRARQPIDYQVGIVRRMLSPHHSSLARACGADGVRPVRCLAVIDRRVDELYGDHFREYFAAWRMEVVWHSVAGDESVKTMAEAVRITEAMSAMGILRRTEKVLAIGGGVLMDVVGLAASLYRRGIPYLRVPTTLVGQVDAGVGVKTGVNHDRHKNRLGTYYAPSAALIDPEFLRTLPERHIANGLAEIIKMALVKDSSLFDVLELAVPHLDAAMLAESDPVSDEILARAIAGMLSELEPNLWESVLERPVDYGHTFSPSLELQADPPLLHGEAVAVDMAICLALAHTRAMISLVDTERALALLQAAALPITHPVFTADLVGEALRDAVKHRDGLQRVPLTKGIGAVEFVNDLAPYELDRAVAFVQERAAQPTWIGAGSVGSPEGMG